MKKKATPLKATRFVRMYPDDYEQLRSLAFDYHLPLPKILQKLIADAQKNMSMKASDLFD